MPEICRENSPIGQSEHARPKPSIQPNMHFMKRTLFASALILIASLWGCSRLDPRFAQDHPTLIFKESTGRVIAGDSLDSPQEYQVSPPQRLPARILDSIPYKTNQQALKRRLLPIQMAFEQRIPGTEPYLPAEKTPATPEQVSLGLPDIMELKDAHIKENNPYSFNSYSKIQGLSHDDITCFAEDKLGNIWMGTSGGGISRFDGKHLAHYSKKQGLRSTAVSDILHDNQGNIWTASASEGISRLDGTSILHFSKKEGLASDFVNLLFEDRDGNIWIGYWDKGLSRYDGESFTHYSIEQGLPGTLIVSIQQDQQGHIWIAAYEGGIARFDGQAFHVYEDSALLGDKRITHLYLDPQDNLWISLFDGKLLQIKPDQIWQHTILEGLPDNQIHYIQTDRNGKIWLSTYGQGLVLLDGDSYKVFNQGNGLTNNFPNLTFEDSRGIIWIGHWNGGFSRYQGDIFVHHRPKEGFNQVISGVGRDPGGKLWITSQDGGLMRFDGQSFVQFTPDLGIQYNYIDNFTFDAQGHLWAGISINGLYRFDGKSFFHYKLDSIAQHPLISAIYYDKRDQLWLGLGSEGLARFDGKTLTHYKQLKDFFDHYIFSISEDPEGNIWLGSWGGGLCRFDGEQFTLFTQEDGLAGNFIYSTFWDSFGNLWVGSEGYGLSLYNGKGFLNFNTSHGLNDNFALSIAQGPEGNLYVGGRFGLSILPAERLEIINQYIQTADVALLPQLNSHNFRTLTYADGFLGIGNNKNAIHTDADGILWIGANDRLTAYTPGKACQDTLAPQIQISQIGLFNERIPWGNLLDNRDTIMILGNGLRMRNVRFDGLSPWYQLPQNLELTHNNNFITFHFIGITTRFTEKVKYSYMLEGHDQKWHRPTSTAEAHYGNLPAGRYTFRVKAMNAQGIWSDEQHFQFQVHAPWWESLWAYLLYLLAGIFTLRYFIRHRERNLVLRNKLLDKEVEVARQTIEFKQNILANVSHELRTPLTGILGMTEILNKTALDEKQKEYLQALRQSGENLKGIINHILDFAKLEAGKAKLKPENFSLNTLLFHAEKLFTSYPKKGEVLFESHIDSQIPQSLFSDRGRINQVVQNLLSNAMKFTTSGKISLQAELLKQPQLSENNLKIRITVKDTGTGIAPEAIPHLFVPFSQVEMNDTRNIDSTGLGLAISKKLAEMLGGEIGVESQKGKGSTFWFTFLAENPCPQLVKSSNIAKPALDIPVRALRILFVEDKKVNQMVVKLMLESLGHSVTLATNGQEAVDMFLPGLFDAVLMDIQMPIMDGITATQIIKEQYQHIPPIIGLSANAFQGDREKYIKQGMDEYLTKPVRESDLKEVLARLCP